MRIYLNKMLLYGECYDASCPFYLVTVIFTDHQRVAPCILFAVKLCAEYTRSIVLYELISIHDTSGNNDDAIFTNDDHNDCCDEWGINS